MIERRACRCGGLGETWTTPALYGKRVDWRSDGAGGGHWPTVKALYLSIVDFAMRGSVDGARRDYARLSGYQATMINLGDHWNAGQVGVLLGDAGEKIHALETVPGLRADLVRDSANERAIVEEGVRRRNEDAENERRRQQRYLCAVAKVGPLANVPGVPELVCGDVLETAKKVALVAGALFVASKLR